MNLRHSIGIVLFGAALAALPFGLLVPRTAVAAVEKTATPAQKNQQNRMRQCAAQYRAKKIPKNQYRDFMRTCLKTHKTPVGKPATAPAQTTP